MKKLLLLPFLVVSLNSFAGWEMLFCDSVDDRGNCTAKSESFILSGKEVSINAVLKNTEGIHTTKVYFEVYSVNPTTFTEDLVASEELRTETNATVAIQSIKLSKKGSYVIKVRDSYKDYITSRELSVE